MNLKRRHTDRDPFASVCLLASFFMLLFVFTQGAKAEDWFDPNDIIAEAGVGYMFTDEDDTETEYQLRAGYKNVYVTWGNTDAHSTSILGQQIFESEITTLGLGVRYPFKDDFEVYIEVGEADLDSEYSPNAGAEVAYTFLVGRHAVEGRPVPVPCARYRAGCYDSDWNLEQETPYATIGVAWAPVDHIKVQMSYRFMNPSYDVYIKKPDWKEGEGYWRESNNIDMGSANATILFFW